MSAPVNAYYDPPWNLSGSELTVIGQALLGWVSQEVTMLRSIWPEVIKACDGEGTDPIEVVREREVERIHRGYMVYCRFVINPFSFDLFVRDSDFPVES